MVATSPDCDQSFSSSRTIGKPLFYPPTINPSPEILPPLKGLFAALRNPLEYWSEPFFEKSLHVARFMGRTFLTVIDPDLTKQVLADRAHEFRKSPFIEQILRPALGDGLLTAAGDSWRAQRRLAEPAFRSDKIDELVPSFARTGAAATERLLRSGSGTPVEVLGVMEEASLDAIMDALVGAASSNLDRSQIRREVAIYIATLGQVDLLDLAGVPAWLPRPWRSRGYVAARRLRESAARVIAERRKSGVFGNDLLSFLIRAQESDLDAQLTNEQLVDNVLTFISAGFETTPLAVTWTLSILANLPELQQQLADEAEEVCPNCTITAERIQRLELHGRVIQEAMRLYPPVASIGLSPIARTKVAGVALRPGDHITIAIYLLHRHKRLWDDPSAFDPDRFTPARSRARHRFAYLPFGAGKRICIGMRLATVEATVILASAIRRAVFAPDPHHVIRPLAKVWLRPQGGMPLCVSPRI